MAPARRKFGLEMALGFAWLPTWPLGTLDEKVRITTQILAELQPPGDLTPLRALTPS